MPHNSHNSINYGSTMWVKQQSSEPCAREFINAEWFTSIKQAQVVAETWLIQDRHIRPNQALNNASIGARDSIRKW